MTEQDDVPSRGYDAALLRRLLGFLGPYRWVAVLALVLLLSAAGLALVGPVLTQRALDVAVPRRDLGLLGTLAVTFFGVLILEFIVEYAQALLTNFIGQRVMFDLRMRLLDRKSVV